ncbi:DNA mismatch repair endonuclease MutL [Ketogulonicigenium vulgare]|uniref:DNA mismatch repair protein MutL n=1 Tax=Ketogulonicigenium vulgare (strain WSH-001) TaxID=759362 RepID=F9Y4C8_KETVW|nr:DNA mismatch repair endonuclease MutL [Ketogulonicigenium vulgare]AEM41741.1 DNA mismatch repair protein MutL [Ketogulonicigenium vulgare WSH-001]ALJ81849.1 DNA mismatch repair protein MutL [Ketogulonicigenium vulgare]AOZ55495.1 mismatch repair protein MutL [Ketogulonicigenium vulgare]
MSAPPTIQQLGEDIVNRIAAGEVVERPASAVKELVENALDAGARRIDVTIADGGRTLIRVVDDGWGIAPAQLPLALARHATSKIDGSDLLNIHTFGFRGEALASLGAVGRLSLTSRRAGEEGAQITVNGGATTPTRPAALSGGTVVELRDLFFATPARLKFLRSDRAEAQAVADVMRRLAMAEPFVAFTLRDASGGEDRQVLRVNAETGDLFDALHGRLAAILGREFAENAVRVDAERDGFHMTGYAALPTYSRGAAVAQYLFVNNRPVRDKLLIGALKGAYADLLSRDRHPAAALFVSCDPQLVDVNVHPAKSEVRFRDPALVRGLLVSAVRHALLTAGHRASTTVADATLAAFQPEPAFAPRAYQMPLGGGYGNPSPQALRTAWFAQSPVSSPAAPQGFAEVAQPSARIDDPVGDDNMPLGAARAQIHENYIIAQTARGMVIVDQHAAHERLVYERLKEQMAHSGVAAQALLIPDIVELGAAGAGRLLALANDLSRLGLTIEPFGGGSVAVRETPAILGEVDSPALLRDILDELDDSEQTSLLGARLDAVLSRVACHGSIRSGRRMRAEEMNALLREMEATPASGQCNHGRPTYVELRLIDIERLFGRRG